MSCENRHRCQQSALAAESSASACESSTLAASPLATAPMDSPEVMRDLRVPTLSSPHFADIERAVTHGSFDYTGTLRLGSWAVNVHSTRYSFAEHLAFLYKQKVEQHLRADLCSGLPEGCPRLYFMHGGFCQSFEQYIANETARQGSIPEDGYLTKDDPAQGISLLMTEVIKALVVRTPDSTGIYVLVDDEKDNLYQFRVHLSFVMNKVLFDYKRIYVHAGAVRVKNQVSMFVGDRGSGKSTTCLRLGAAGATILSDDHVLLQHHQKHFRVSGCDQNARITKKTEAFLAESWLLKKPFDLKQEPQDFAGVLKKEFATVEYFDSHPYHDYRVNHIFFLRRGPQFKIEPMPRQQAVIELITKTKTSLRFTRAEEFHRYLDFFSELVGKVQVFALELTPNLQDLDHLVAFLGGASR